VSAETPKGAARRLAAPEIAKGFKPEALHTYRAADGTPLYWRIRAKHPNGEKWIRPMKLNGHGYEKGEPSFPNGKPLYHLDRIAAEPDAAVWITEGEKAADAMTKAGLVATTSGGADSAEKADWSPLRERRCKLWPDNDEAGARYMLTVSERLRGLASAVETIDVARLGLPPKADAVEWLGMHPEASTGDFDALPVASPQPPQNNSPESDLERVEFTDAAKIKPEAVNWYWQGWIAAGKLHILAGPPGTGKTTLALALGATLSIGGAWPDRSRSRVRTVAIWSGEDSPADVLVPRLSACGANLDRIKLITGIHERAGRRAFDPATDTDLLLQSLAGVDDLGLLIVDPIVSAIAGDAHKSNDVRRGLQPLADLAEATGCAVIGISHFSKGTAGRDVVERVTGSVAFGAAARVVLAAAKRSDDEGGGRILVRAKSNLGPDTGGFGYDLRRVPLESFPNVEGQCVVWGQPLEGTAKALLAAAEMDESDDDRTEHAEATEWLIDTLREAGGELPGRDIVKLGTAFGFTKSTLQRARHKAGVMFQRSGFGSDVKSVWRLGHSFQSAHSFHSSQPEKGETNETNGANDELVQVATAGAETATEPF
jgi:hypothetical protein